MVTTENEMRMGGREARVRLLKKVSFFRRYSQDNSFYYPPEKYFGQHGPTPELPGWDSGDGEHAIPVHLFAKHTQELHLDQVRVKDWRASGLPDVRK
jgi:hypothetical protein